MTEYEQTQFYIEDIQPSRLGFSNIKSRFVFGLVSLVSGGLIIGPFFGLILGLITGLLTWISFNMFSGESGGPWKISGLIWTTRLFLGVGLLSGLIFGLILGLIFGVGKNWLKVKPIQRLSWSWKGAWKGLRVGLIFGLAWGLIVLVLQWLRAGLPMGMLYGTRGGLVMGLSVGLIIGIRGGLSNYEMENRNKPAEVIIVSMRTFLIVGLIVGMFSGLIFGIFGGWVFGQMSGLEYGMQQGFGMGIQAGLFFGIISGLMYGGNFLIAHFLSRWLLYRSHHIPWNIKNFLDYATERIFLRRVGGGYIFIHRMLMEHFAAMYQETNSKKE